MFIKLASKDIELNKVNNTAIVPLKESTLEKVCYFLPLLCT